MWWKFVWSQQQGRNVCLGSLQLPNIQEAIHTYFNVKTHWLRLSELLRDDGCHWCWWQGMVLGLVVSSFEEHPRLEHLPRSNQADEAQEGKESLCRSKLDLRSRWWCSTTEAVAAFNATSYYFSFAGWADNWSKKARWRSTFRDKRRDLSAVRKGELKSIEFIRPDEDASAWLCQVERTSQQHHEHGHASRDGVKSNPS